jgi:drug/metabolite transporter (DMT)-like permease
VLLLFVSVAWGSAFPLMKNLIDRLPVEDLLAQRYMIAALTLLLMRPRCLRGMPRRTWGCGALLGVMFGVGQTAQAVALGSLPSAVSGFAVGCSVVITPILALALFRTRVPARVWAGVGLAMAGVVVFAFLDGIGDEPVSPVALGVTLGAAALYAGHTLLLARLSRSEEGFHAYALTVIQLGVIGLMTGGFAARDGLSVPQSVPDWGIMAHLSVVSCALGFLARSYAQAHVAAVPSAVLMSSQPLWVTVIAVIWFAEPLGWSVMVGGALMVGAMLLAVTSRTAGPPPADPPPDPVMLQASRRAARRLADLKVKRDDLLKAGKGAELTALPSVCVEGRGCRLNTHSVKGSGQPSLDRLIQRATLIVRARNLQGPGCCRSVTLVGRCLCVLMEEAEHNGDRVRPSWFRPR